MQRTILLSFFTILSFFSSGQRIETIYLDPKDSTVNMYIAVIPEGMPPKALLFLLDGFGASPQGVLLQTELPVYAAKQGILTIIPVLKTGALYFGVDNASQQSLKEQIAGVIDK